MEFGFEPVCDQLRTSFERASVMEFGSNPAASCMTGRLDSATRQLMSMPRCGRPDIERADDDDVLLEGAERKKRYAAGNSASSNSTSFR